MKFVKYADEIILSLQEPDDFWASELEDSCKVLRDLWQQSYGKNKGDWNFHNRKSPIFFKYEHSDEPEFCRYELHYYDPVRASTPTYTTNIPDDVQARAIKALRRLILFVESTPPDADGKIPLRGESAISPSEPKAFLDSQEMWQQHFFEIQKVSIGLWDDLMMRATISIGKRQGCPGEWERLEALITERTDRLGFLLCDCKKSDTFFHHVDRPSVTLAALHAATHHDAQFPVAPRMVYFRSIMNGPDDGADEPDFWREHFPINVVPEAIERQCGLASRGFIGLHSSGSAGKREAVGKKGGRPPYATPVDAKTCQSLLDESKCEIGKTRISDIELGKWALDSNHDLPELITRGLKLSTDDHEEIGKRTKRAAKSPKA